MSNKKGMEMWELITIILVLILLIAVIAWYAGLGKAIEKLLESVGNW